MGCGQCSSGGCGSVKTLATDEKTNHKTAGCSSGGCSTGCTKLNTFDWLSDMALPSSMRYDVVEIKFKGGRKGYFRNTKKLDLYTGDFVACQMPTGFHVGTVSLQGELVRLQLIKKGVPDNNEITKILRKATEQDLEKHEQAINRDMPTLFRVRQLISDFKLKMKLSDVEFQSDNSKATFYYSAEDRVDFRELIKGLASEFRIRVDMRQISMRQEAARIGGIGSCGRELCCSTWLTDFKSISTSAARYQNLSLNPAKLSGQCGRLKCCLNYELETYVDALQDIPKVTKALFTEKGEAYLQKTDIFRRLMWFGYKNDSNWYPIPTTRVVEIMEMNKAGKKPVSLEDLNLLIDVVRDKEPINNELDRLDKKLAAKTPGNKKRPNRKGKPQSKGNARPNSNRPPQAKGNQEEASSDRKPNNRPPRAKGNQGEVSADRKPSSRPQQAKTNQGEPSSDRKPNPNRRQRPPQAKTGQPADKKPRPIKGKTNPGAPSSEGTATASNDQASPARKSNNRRNNRKRPNKNNNSSPNNEKS
ncbi:regulatory iron-sulfur-containing complex subunit RicT [Arcticibacterium luteifluviistationis]|uniref:Signal peptidase-like protein n=1 Tax=Arcticibacterium luteifluviistationis TaxID=1784714 RepID=A0A2Z4GFG6_9BACT|nr:regulatory iron-sulfur-containing complex subunit RicT [Arcticibacterium luteifluviistationis]AWW00133.1 Signal peptidase-like protein [Arcticibacterium luteifluviistationis]